MDRTHWMEGGEGAGLREPPSPVSGPSGRIRQAFPDKQLWQLAGS